MYLPLSLLTLSFHSLNPPLSSAVVAHDQHSAACAYLALSRFVTSLSYLLQRHALYAVTSVDVDGARSTTLRAFASSQRRPRSSPPPFPRPSPFTFLIVLHIEGLVAVERMDAAGISVPQGVRDVVNHINRPDDGNVTLDVRLLSVPFLGLPFLIPASYVLFLISSIATSYPNTTGSCHATACTLLSCSVSLLFSRFPFLGPNDCSVQCATSSHRAIPCLPAATTCPSRTLFLLTQLSLVD